VFLDDKRFWPIYQRAEQLDVPIYFHPATPDSRVGDVYYADYAKDFPMVVRAAWGYTVETATLAIRMVLSGVLDAYPRLKIVLGHLGETLPFQLWRFDSRSAPYGWNLPKPPSQYIKENLWVTLSGMYDAPPLHCSLDAVGRDRVS
jgi:2,3-dihydroxybenzoate decarboxylase